MDSVPEIINLKLRHEHVHIHKKELEELGSSDWFLKNLIKYPSDKKDSNNNTIYEIWEDKKTVMSIFDSLRFNSLVIYPDVSLDYLILLCDKWCVPSELIDKIIEKKDTNEELTKSKNIKSDKLSYLTLECVNCKTGFKIIENNSDSCKFHSGGINNNLWFCCGQSSDVHYCKIGYHVPYRNTQDIERLHNLMNKIDKY